MNPSNGSNFVPNRMPFHLEEEKPAQEMPPIRLEPSRPDAPNVVENRAAPANRVQAAETDSVQTQQRAQKFQRSLNLTGQGATRVRTFHTKLTDAAMSYLAGLINEWLDASPDVEVKFASTTVGVVEGKRSEPHLIITVWY